MIEEYGIHVRFEELQPFLNEHKRQLFAANEATSMCYLILSAALSSRRILTTKRRLAELLHASPSVIKELAKASPEKLYREWDIEKPNGQLRHIENPCYRLKTLQGRIADLLSRITPPGFLYCPVKGRSYVSNAFRHIDGKVVRSLDIKDYFPSTSDRRVSWFFHSRMQCAPDVARILIGLTTIKGRLPTGGPHSSLLSFYAHEDMWRSVNEIVERAGCLLSVYMDDVAISGDTVSNQVFWDVRRAIHRYGLRYHKEKAYSGRKKEITGVIMLDRKVVVPSRQHLKIHNTRQQLREELDPALREKLANRLRSLEAQAKQLMLCNA